MRTPSRIGRYLITALLIAVLVLEIASAALWIRGGFVRESFDRTADVQGPGLMDHRRLRLFTGSGYAMIMHSRQLAVDMTDSQPGRSLRWSYSEYPPRPRWIGQEPEWVRRAGVRWSYSDVTQGIPTGPRYVTTIWRIELDHWLLLVSGALLMFLLLRVRRRMTLPLQRMRAGLCVACGYDLRGSPQRCPECGATAATTVR